MVATNSNGNVYVVEAQNHRVQLFGDAPVAAQPSSWGGSRGCSASRDQLSLAQPDAPHRDAEVGLVAVEDARHAGGRRDPERCLLARGLAVVPPWNGDAFRIDQRPRWAEHRYCPLLRDWARIEPRVLDRVTLGANRK